MEGSASKRVLKPPRVYGMGRSAVLRLLQLNKHVSGADIARQSGLSEAQVSRILADLIKDKLVREEGLEISTGGRPGRRLELEPARVAFGAEMQEWKTSCAIANVHGRVVESRSFPTPKSAEKAFEKIAEVFIDFRNRFEGDRVVGAGLCVRGTVDTEKGVLVRGGHPDWDNVPIREILEARLGEPTFIESNVRAAAIAEYNYGWRGVHGKHCFLYVKVDNEVRMGILLEGKAYHGPRMAAGGLGQMVITTSSGTEGQDRLGCLEQLVSNPAICDRYSALAAVQDPRGAGDTASRVRHISRWATNGDMLARKALEESGRYLGIGISNMVWAMDAEVVVVDGAITNAWRLIEPVLRAQLLRFPGLLIARARFGGHAALIGATMLPFTTRTLGALPRS